MLGFELMVEMSRRLTPDRGLGFRQAVYLIDEAGQQAHYCLDAPSDIPAGGMYSDELVGEPLPMPITVERDL